MNRNQYRDSNTGKAASTKNKKVAGMLAGAALAAAIAFGSNGAISAANAQSASTTVTTATTSANLSAYADILQQNATDTLASDGFNKGGRHGAQRANSGTISAISGNSLTLKQGDVVVIQATLNASTVYTKAGQTIQQSDLKVGQKASVRTTTASDGTVSVSQVDVILDHAGGTISAMDATSLTLTRSDNTTVKVSLDAATKYLDLGKSISFADLKTGMRLEASGELNADGSLKAEVVNVQHDRLGGTVTAINGNTLTIQVDGRGGKGNRPDNAANPATPANGSTTPATAATSTTKTVIISNSTTYMQGGQSAQLSNLAVGARINAVGSLSSDANSMSALQIMVELPRYDGQVTSVNGSTIVLQERSGTSRTIEVNSSTSYLNGQATASLSDIKVGANLHVEGQLDASGKMTASVAQMGQAKGPHEGMPNPKN